MTDRLRAITLGTLLGDGNLNRRGSECRLLCKHAESQSVLLEWKRSMFDDITNMPVNYFQQEVRGKLYNFGQFTTLTHPVFTEIYNLFYRNSVKVISQELVRELVDPMSLAVWIMDDGAKEHVGLTLQTHSFTLEEVNLLRETLYQRFNLKTLLRLNKGKSIIYFPKDQMKNLRSLVDDYLLPEYRYKFPLTP